ncbi:MAG: hypothetical protein HY731_04260 [Candidatus Tectomicrobia bacterium]|nr:hypothetical protein [Candidatus Tectomicrobia bacterium]
MAVTKLEIISRELLLGGKPFGSTGSYEVLKGIVTFAADPAHLLNQRITDIDKAPRTTNGNVEWSADFVLLQPADPEQGNHRLLFEVLNRGRILVFRMFDNAPQTPDLTHEEYVGNGFLLQQGYTVVWCGWQWDVPRRDGSMGMEAPLAMEGNSSVSGKVLCQWWPDETTAVLLLADREHHPYPTIDLLDPDASLTVRDYDDAPRQTISRDRWQFARLEGGSVVPDPEHIYLPSGFQAGKIYECVYRTSKAPIVGLGLLAMRDTVSFLRHGSIEEKNPCAGQIEYAYGFGASQSGRFLRHFLYLSLNEDERGRIVFDGVIPHIAGARRGEFNHRFAQPSANTMQGPNTIFPFTDNVQTDRLTGQTDGLLRRIGEEGKLPKIFTINSSAEYWRGDGSLVHTSVDRSSDADIPESVRIYLFAGTQHAPGVLPPKGPEDGALGQHPLNSIDYSPLLRAALMNLDRWVSQNEPPPPSQYPCLKNGTAVEAWTTGLIFKAIPGVTFPSYIPTPRRLDFGPEWAKGVASWLSPKLGKAYRTLVSAVDQAGNEVAGIRLPDLTVPLATYMGWNPRHPKTGASDQLMRMQGSTIPFAPTRAERERMGDPRLSIEERYPSKEVYLEQVRKAAEALIKERYLLKEDLESIMEQAARRYDLFIRRE